MSHCTDKWIIYNKDEAIQLEYSWYQCATWVRDHPERYPAGYHHQGTHWTRIYSVLPINLYKVGIEKVVHRKLSPKNIECLRKVREGKRVYWIHSVHHEGHCPGCVPLVLVKRNPAGRCEKPKLTRRNHNSGGVSCISGGAPAAAEICLVTITHEEMADPLHLCSGKESIEANGNIYTPIDGMPAVKPKLVRRNYEPSS